jgi:NADP-dependent 3-hydroxy acid dehydrogenase YdfG
VDNAALRRRTGLEDGPADEIDALIETGVRVVVEQTRTQLPALVERHGAVPTVSSTAARHPTR